MPPAPELVQPAHLWVPEHVSSAGGEAVGLIESCIDPETGSYFKVDPEQRLALDAILAERAGGRWAAFEAAVIAGRQNIKTFLFAVVTLADLYLFGSRLVVWTAHEFSTTSEALRWMELVIGANDHLARRVLPLRHGGLASHQNGEEGIEFRTGQRLRFKARTKTGGRGLTGDRVILDEAFALQPSHMGSLMPTMSAKSVTGNPQILYGSSAGLESSGVLRSIRDRGRAGGDPGLAYIEWTSEPGECATPNCDHHYGIDGCLLDDQGRWQQANLALGRRISFEWVENERRSLPPDEFARERLGWWDEPTDGATPAWSEFTEVDWRACRSGGALSPRSWAVDVDENADGNVWASIACAEPGAFDLAEVGEGTSWVVYRLRAFAESHGFNEVALNPDGLVGQLRPALEDAGFTIVDVSGRKFAAATELILTSVRDRAVRYPEMDGKGGRALDAAAAGAVTRDAGDGASAWSRKASTVDIGPLIAATCALWHARNVDSVYEGRGVRSL